LRSTYLEAVDTVLGPVVQVFETHAFAGRHDGVMVMMLAGLVWFVVMEE
jgi:hypothetical protein